MSYGGTVARGKGNVGGSARGGNRPNGPAAARKGGAGGPGRSSESDDSIDWERVAVFGTGIALGAALGAGVALLFAPASGDQARAAIWRTGTRWVGRGRNAWDDLRDELEWAARRGKRRLGRRVQRARWAAEDFMDGRGRPDRWWPKRRQASDRERPSAEIEDQNVQEIVETIC